MSLITESRLRKQSKKGIPNPFLINEGDKITPAALDFLRDRQIRIEILKKNKIAVPKESVHSEQGIPTGISNRHVHLSNDHIEVLFGKDYELTQHRPLSQLGQFAAKEQVTLLGPKGFIQNVRVLGPARRITQVEISKTDGFLLGIHPPVRLSGSTENTPGIIIVGPENCIAIEEGVIIAKRHVHMSPVDAKKFGVVQGDELMLKTTGDRPLIFSDVVVRVNENYALDFHVDLDEGNAAGIKNGDIVRIVGVNGKLFERTGG